jgi:hypothetical protein
MGEVEGGFPVSDAEVQELYDMIDPSQK